LKTDIGIFKGVSEGFELPGSVPQYSPSRSLKIDYMTLAIKPNLKNEKNNLENCQEKLDITTLTDINHLMLDIAEIKVNSVNLSENNYNKNSNKISNNIKIEFNDKDKDNPDKLIIKFSETIKKDTSLSLDINYSAGFDPENKSLGKPRSGFHFISFDKPHCSKSFQTWTQGQANESRYWFPCLDEPQIKFPREVHITVPEDYTVISNGVKENVIEHFNGNNIKEYEWIWKESESISTYLTSIVIGKFKNKTIPYQRNGNGKSIPLYYYWSEEVEKRKYDPLLTYGDTPNVLSFIEGYLKVEYPYKKYSQVAVEDFDYGGMENASCTTLEGELFHDENALPNYIFDDVVVIHELAHQWFGDLVTCKNWSYIWLNEGFATYFESLYLDKDFIDDKSAKVSRDKFYYYLITSIIDVYMFETLEYKRPLVTKIYKHPDDLLDGHSYQKGASILHMLRSEIGDENFSNSLKDYLTLYRNKSVETDDLRKVMEDVSGVSLEKFFDQWVYREGHPVLDINLELSKDELKIVVKQVNQSIINQNLIKQGIIVNDPKAIEPLIDEQDIFEFPLDVKLYFSDSEPKLFKLNINKNNYEQSIKLEKGYEQTLKFISIDPELKILKEINSYKVEDKINEGFNKKFSSLSLLVKQLKYGETVVERIDAARLLQAESPSKDTLNSIKDSITSDPFYGVSLQSLNTITSYADPDKIIEEEIRSYAYTIIESFLNEIKTNNSTSSSIEDKRIQSSLISSFSQFKKFHNKKSLDIVKSFVNNTNWFIAQSAIIAIGRIASNLALKEKEDEKDSKLTLQEKKEIIEFLKNIVNKERDNNKLDQKSFRNLLARGAISGLQNFAADKEEKIVLDIANFLILCSSYGNDFLIRRDAIPVLGDFLRYKIKDNDKDVERFNYLVFNHLKNVIKSSRFGLQTRACQALVKKLPEKPDEENIKILEILTWIAEHDPDGSVRREAEVSINQIRKRMKE
jgi:aminopeptidase N